MYWDLVLLLNFFFDFLLLYSVNIVLKRNVNINRIFLGGLVGSLSTFLVFFDLSSSELFIYKVIVSILMIVVSFDYKDIKYFINNMVYLYMISMILGGFLYFVDNEINLNINNYYLVLLGAPLILGIYIMNSRNLKNNYSHYYKAKVLTENDEIVVNAFLDTGNKLKDPYSNKGIILVNKKLLKPVDNYLLVPFHTLNNSSILKCVKGVSLKIDGKVNNSFLVGISEEDFFIDGVDCIISERIMEELK